MSITPQYTFDANGNPVGVLLSIEEWNAVAAQLDFGLPDWQKKMIDDRLADYFANPNDLTDWELVLGQLNVKD